VDHKLSVSGWGHQNLLHWVSAKREVVCGPKNGCPARPQGRIKPDFPVHGGGFVRTNRIARYHK
jgi:hypothetical protein